MKGVRIGDPVVRKEDARLVSGRGRFGDDDPAPSATAWFVRSPHAHARLVSIEIDEARAAPRVLAVLTGAEALADGLQPIPHSVGSSHIGSDVPLRQLDGSERLTSRQMPLPLDAVRYVGEPVVLVVAQSLTAAKDAAERVRIVYEELAAVSRALDALEPEAPQIWSDIPGNLALDSEVGDRAATEAAFQSAAHRVRLNSWVQRVTGVHMEPRTVAAEWNEATGALTVRASHGIGVNHLRQDIGAALRLPLDRVRVVAPQDVGGNFGTRNATYPEMVAVAWAAQRLRRPVRHTAERTEAFLSDFQGRDLEIDAELALDESGRFLALRSTNVSNLGAHTASFVPLNKGVQLMSGAYRIPLAHYRARAALTNTPSTIPYRSAGRPEAIYAIERLIDLAARQCGFDPVELRRRNLVRAHETPYRNPAGVTYDHGDYHAVMERAMEIADWSGFPARRAESIRRGLCRGRSLSTYIETTSGNPLERAVVTVAPEGGVDVVIGTQSTGQGHETSFSQVVADWLGVPFEAVTIRSGDTDFVTAGGGSHSGRSMRLASLVLRKAADEIIEKGRLIAAALLETSSQDIRFEEGVFTVAGTDRSLGLFELAAAAAEGANLPQALRGPLTGVCEQTTPGLAFPYGACVCEVEVDPQTGELAIVRYASVDDVGRAINPLILHGQTHGGIAQGLGQALMERCWYSREDAHALSASMMDYAMPRADHFPFFVTELSETPASSHPLGVRPGGEGGTTPALGAAINAIVDALAEFGVTHVEMPATPWRVWRAIREAVEKKAASAQPSP